MTRLQNIKDRTRFQIEQLFFSLIRRNNLFVILWNTLVDKTTSFHFEKKHARTVDLYRILSLKNTN